MVTDSNSLLVSQLDLSDCKLKKARKGIWSPKSSAKRLDYFLHKDEMKYDIKIDKYGAISNEWFKQKFYELCIDHHKSINYARKNRYEEDKYDVQFKWVYRFPYMVQEELGYEYISSYIRFPESNLAIWGKDLILFADDYRLHDKEGKLMKYSEYTAAALNVGHEVKERGEYLPGIGSEALVKQWAQVYLWILSGNKKLTFDLLLWHVLFHVINNLTIEEGVISSDRIYELCLYEFDCFTSPNKTTKVPKAPKKQHHTKYYAAPGYDKQKLIRDMKDNKRKEGLKYAFIYCKEKGLQTNEQNLILAYKACGGYCSKTKKGLGSMHTTTLIKYVEEMKNDPAYRIFVGEGIVRKTHKQQERSKWYEMIDLSVKAKDNYNEIIQVFPNVKYSTYKNQRSRKSHNNS